VFLILDKSNRSVNDSDRSNRVRGERRRLKSRQEPDIILLSLGRRKTVEDRILEVLKDYFVRRDDIAFAFLFGSSARGKI